MTTASSGPPSTRLALVDRLSAAFTAELRLADPRAAVAWPELPDVASLAEHVGTVHRWVTQIVLHGDPVEESSIPGPPPGALLAWFDGGRDDLLAALAVTPPSRPCWTIGGRIGTAAVWQRRMVFEHGKHLIDLRAAGGRGWTVAPELSPTDYADGIDELFEVFLPRSRPKLTALPAEIVLEATDTGRIWRVSQDWMVAPNPTGSEAVRLRATAGELALALWERSDPLRDPGFEIAGDRAAAAAFTNTQIHPW